MVADKDVNRRFCLEREGFGLNVEFRPNMGCRCGRLGSERQEMG